MNLGAAQCLCIERQVSLYIKGVPGEKSKEENASKTIEQEFDKTVVIIIKAK